MLLHEVLVCMAGYAGEIIIRDMDDTDEIPRVRRTYVNPALKMTDSERAIVNDILVTATHVETCRISCKTLQRSSYYHRALVNGVDEILRAFEHKLTVIERTIIGDSAAATLTTLAADMSHFAAVFATLSVPLSTLATLSGARFLSSLYDLSLSGEPTSASMFMRLVVHVHAVMFAHIYEWGMFGILRDDSGVDETEFFIRQPPRHNSAVIDHSAVPSYIPITIAHAILFIGNAQRILQRIKQTDAFALSETAPYRQFAADIEQLKRNPNFDVNNVRDCVEPFHTYMTQTLHSLLMNTHDTPGTSLFDVLRQCNSLFTLSHSSFYSAFFVNAQPIMSQPPTLRVDNELAQCVRQSRPASEEWIKRAKFTLEANAINYTRFTNNDKSLILNGNVDVVTDALALTSPSAAVWLTQRKCADRDWSTQFTVAHTLPPPPAQSSSSPSKSSPTSTLQPLAAFSFVIQNDHSTALATFNGSNTSLPMCSGIVNALIIEFSQRSINGHYVESVSVWHVPYAPTGRASGDGARLLHRATDDYGLFSGKTQTIRISYTPSAHGDDQMIISITQRTQPILSCAFVSPYKCKQLLTLEAARAWVGLCSSAQSKSGITRITTWSFIESELSPATQWRSMRIDITIDSPFNLIIDNNSLERYNVLFRLLLALKRSQLALHDAWILLKNNKILLNNNNNNNNDNSNFYHLKNHLRVSMQFIIDTFLYYIQSDILYQQYELFISRLKKVLKILKPLEILI